MPVFSPLPFVRDPRWRRSRSPLFPGVLLLGALVPGLPCVAQYQADFSDPRAIVRVGASDRGGWSWYGGDGEATVDFLSGPGHARMVVDARLDRYNTWWAVIRTRVDEALAPADLLAPGRELRIEARVRVSHAPRRVNLHLATTGTSHYDHLREYDIPEAGVWHTISMTTTGFPRQPGEPIFAQLAMMDWGQELFSTEIDHLRVAVVDPATSGPDRGNPQRYHPPAPDPASLPVAVTPVAEGLIDAMHPDMAVTNWGAPTSAGSGKRLLAVTPSQTGLLRWDLSAYAGRSPQGSAVLELTTAHLSRLLGQHEEFGRLRVVEILSTAPAWTEQDVTWQNFTGGGPLSAVTNAQPVIDVLIDPAPGALNRIVLPPAVMQRLLDGRSRGLALRALGPINATFHACQSPGPGQAPVLRFALQPAG